MVAMTAAQDGRSLEPFQTYRRLGEIEARPAESSDWPDKYDLRVISISPADWEAGYNPRGMIARNPANHADQWYIAPDYFAKNYAPNQPSPDDAPSVAVAEVVLLLGNVKDLLSIYEGRVDGTISRIDDAITLLSSLRAPAQGEDELAAMRQQVRGLQRWQSAALSWLRADNSPSAFALRRDADDPTLLRSTSEGV